MITDDAKKEIIEHARAESPKECCGLILDENGRISTKRLQNISNEPETSFIFDPEEIYKTENGSIKVIAVYHSHPGESSTPSPEDVIASEELDLPYFIVGLPEIDFSVYTPKGLSVELIGRQFLYGIYDCWTLCRDKLQQDYPELSFPHAPYRELGWWQQPENAAFYYDCLISMGDFVDITHDVLVAKTKQLQINDLFLMQLMSDIANHLGIYTGDGQFMHHVADRKSSLANYGGMWEKNTRHILRHKTLL